VKDFDETAIADNRLFDALDETTCRRVLEGGRRMTMPAGTPVFAPGDECQGLPLVIEGEIRVQMIGASGNEIVLYRIQGGEMCPLSLGCLLSRNSHQSEAIVEKDSEVLVLSPALTTELMDQAVCFRQAILESYGQRLQSLMLVIEEVAFRRLDERLAEKLVERQFQGQLAVTHQDLAVELGTAGKSSAGCSRSSNVAVSFGSSAVASRSAIATRLIGSAVILRRTGPHE